jgi:adenine-specific DNA-methyltransferase
MIGLHHKRVSTTLWLTPSHQVLATLRPRTLGGEGRWSAVLGHHFERGRNLRRNQTFADQRLWAQLRGKQLGWKFRRQHQIGPYIADFYSHAACLVVEIDGDSHSTLEAQRYDAERDRYMRALGLEIVRFANTDIYQHLDAVVEQIWQLCQQRYGTAENAAWVRADELQADDFIFFGLAGEVTPIETISTQWITEKMVYDLHIYRSHVFLTDICAIHSCDINRI